MSWDWYNVKRVILNSYPERKRSMVLNIIIALLLFSGVVVGMKRGAVLYILNFIGLIVVLIISYMYYRPFARHLDFIKFNVDKESALSFLNSELVFHNVIAFLILFIISSIVVKTIIRMINSIANLPVLKQLNGLIGGVLGFVIHYAVIFMGLYLILLFPNEMIQNAYNKSDVAQWVIMKTPILSDYFYHWMIQSKII